jgi:hypothetical protein
MVSSLSGDTLVFGAYGFGVKIRKRIGPNVQCIDNPKSVDLLLVFKEKCSTIAGDTDRFPLGEVTIFKMRIPSSFL